MHGEDLHQVWATNYKWGEGPWDSAEALGRPLLPASPQHTFFFLKVWVFGATVTFLHFSFLDPKQSDNVDMPFGDDRNNGLNCCFSMTLKVEVHDVPWLSLNPEPLGGGWEARSFATCCVSAHGESHLLLEAMVGVGVVYLFSLQTLFWSFYIYFTWLVGG